MFVSPDRDVDPVGNPAIRVARSRKVQKGEDKAFETPDARWVATRVEGQCLQHCPLLRVRFVRRPRREGVRRALLCDDVGLRVGCARFARSHPR